jgi:hypothetical protein
LISDALIFHHPLTQGIDPIKDPAAELDVWWRFAKLAIALACPHGYATSARVIPLADEPAQKIRTGGI